MSQPMPMPEQTAAPELQPLLIARAFIKLIAPQHAAAATIYLNFHNNQGLTNELWSWFG